MTALDLIFDFHLNGYRQGPGSDEETQRAFELLRLDYSARIKLLDIGCGTGAQTMKLAQLINGYITALDLSGAFLEKLNHSAAKKGLEDKITTVEASMSEMPFEDQEFDVIWSEGAIYTIGFENGIRQWNRFLKKDGYLAVSEISWLTDLRPKEIETYWKNAYPEIDTISNKISLLEKNGYSPIGHFVLPEYCWLDNYYNPNEARMDAFLKKYDHNEMSINFIEGEREEIRIYQKFKDYFSYGFYIAKKL